MGRKVKKARDQGVRVWCHSPVISQRYSLQNDHTSTRQSSTLANPLVMSKANREYYDNDAVMSAGVTISISISISSA